MLSYSYLLQLLYSGIRTMLVPAQVFDQFSLEAN